MEQQKQMTEYRVSPLVNMTPETNILPFDNRNKFNAIVVENRAMSHKTNGLCCDNVVQNAYR